MSLTRDRALTRRMAATLAAVLLADALFVSVAVVLSAPLLDPVAAAVGDRLALPDALVAGWWVPLAAALLCVCVWAQLRYVRRETLAAVDARPVAADAYPALRQRVTRLAAQLDSPAPALAVVDSQVPNSFVLDGLGRPTLVVSEGLLDAVDGAELDAVLAHELAHLENRDAVVMTLASFLPALTSDRYSLLSQVAGPWGKSRGVWALGLGALYVLGAVATGAGVADPAYAGTFLGGLVIAVVLGGIVLGALAAPTVFLARRLSHYREFAADRGAARLTGEPTALADALRRLDDGATGAPETDKRLAYRDVRGLCLLPHGFHPADDAVGGRDAANGSGDGEAFHVETRSHPPTDERIARLRDLVDG